MTPFCERHIISFLNSLELSNSPIDIALSRYFRANKSLGASDRRVFGETVYAMARWKGLIDWLCPNLPAKDRLFCYRAIDWAAIRNTEEIPLPLRLGMSEFLYAKLSSQYGESQAEKLSTILNKPAPTTIRVNLLKTTRESLFEAWKDRFLLSLCEKASAGIHFQKREPLFSLPEFKQGLFEMQDEGSQLVASLVQAKPGDWVLDYCSGSGGKTLAIAPQMAGKGQIFLHDIRSHVLLEAKKRMKRAGVQNSQYLSSSHPQMNRLKASCDWVLADVPCSGSGTIRRNPDQKWKIDADSLERLVVLQREILSKAAAFLKKGGRLVYATCSLFKEENEDQAKWIEENLFLTPESSPLALLPEEGGADGFFGQTFRKP